MYEVDERDRVVELEELPHSSVDAPAPLIIANEHRVIVAYHIASTWSWTGILQMMRDHIALVRFDAVTYMCIPPNQDPGDGHPLASRGLKSCGAFRIQDSSWIRQLERMYRVRAGRFSGCQHTVLAFRYSIFECISRSFDVRTTKGPIADAIPAMAELLNEPS
jgi:hypothetical protein